MMWILGAFVLAYLTGATWMYVFPWRNANNEKIEIGIWESVGLGQLILMAIFMVGSFLPLARGVDLSTFAVWTLRSGEAVLLLVLLIGRTHVATPMMNEIRMLQESFRKDAAREAVLILLGVMTILVAVIYFRPNATDATPEYIYGMLRTNQLYVMNPYQLEPVQPLLVNHSPLAVLYAVGVSATGIDATVFVQRVLPVFILPGVYGIYRLVAQMVFEDAKQQKTMLLFVYLLLVLEIFTPHGLAMGLLENPWNGQTVLVMVVIPAVFALGIAWIRRMQWQLAPLAMALVLAGQLSYAKGFAPVMISIGVAVLVGLVQRRGSHA